MENVDTTELEEIDTSESDFQFQAGFFNEISSKILDKGDYPTLLNGIVASKNETYQTIGVYIGGSTTAVTGIRYLTTFDPAIYQKVWLVVVGNNLLAIGAQQQPNALAWVSGTTYAVGDAVTYSGLTYIRLIAGAGTTTPNLDTTNWAVSNFVAGGTWRVWDSSAPLGAPTIGGTGWSIGNGAFSNCWYSQVGKTVNFRGTFTIGSTTTNGSGSLTISLPVTAQDTSWQGIGRGTLVLAGVSRAIPMILAPSSTTAFAPQLFNVAGTFITRASITSGNYATVTSGNTIIFNGVYEAV